MPYQPTTQVAANVHLNPDVMFRQWTRHPKPGTTDELGTPRPHGGVQVVVPDTFLPILSISSHDPALLRTLADALARVAAAIESGETL